MRIALCDDDPGCRALLSELAEEFRAARPELDITFSVFEWGTDLIEAAGKLGGFDVCILDIVMREMNGIRLGTQLRQMGFDSKILFLTSSEEYAIEAFKVKAYDYLLKPITREVFFSALDDVLSTLQNNDGKSLIIKTKNSYIKLRFDSILYAELRRRAIVYHLANGKQLESTSIRTSFSEAVKPLLEDSSFVLCGVSIAANLHHITMVEKDALLFGSNTRLFLPRKACTEIRSAWYDFYFNAHL